MVDITSKILVPATDFALMSLDEYKLATGMPSGPNAADAQLEWMIDAQSAVISALCNRVFAKETLIETWRDLGDRRLYLTHWPVKEEDIVSVTTFDGNARLDWELDEGQGKLSIFTDRSEPISIEYTGGYDLPTEAPMALKHATTLLVNSSKAEQASASLTGVRMISHKESRVMFHSPTSSSSTGSPAAGTQATATVQAILGHFIKLWV